MRWTAGPLAVLVAAGVCAAIAAGQSPQRPPPDRFTVVADGHPLAVWSRRPPAPSRAAVLLVHGRTWSSRPDFDLQVPGLERSVLASLAHAGIAAYAVDLRGYGETPRDASGWSTPRRAAADVVAVLAWIARRHPDLTPPAVVGWSRGAAIAMLAAQSPAVRVSALVLFGFAFDPDATFVNLPLPATPGRFRSTAESAAADFISPAVTPPAVVAAFVAQALAADPVLADVRDEADFNAITPESIRVPTLILYGERDPGVVPAQASKLFGRLAASDKRIVVLPGADHAAQLEDTHEAWIAEVAAFVSRPVVPR